MWTNHVYPNRKKRIMFFRQVRKEQTIWKQIDFHIRCPDLVENGIWDA